MELVKFLKSGIIFLSLIGVAMWIGVVWQANESDKMDAACYPIEWTIDSAHNIIAGLVGPEPTWTQAIKFKLVGGCNFFVRRVVLSKKIDENGEGGVRKH